MGEAAKLIVASCVMSSLATYQITALTAILINYKLKYMRTKIINDRQRKKVIISHCCFVVVVIHSCLRIRHLASVSPNQRKEPFSISVCKSLVRLSHHNGTKEKNYVSFPTKQQYMSSTEIKPRPNDV